MLELLFVIMYIAVTTVGSPFNADGLQSRNGNSACDWDCKDMDKTLSMCENFCHVYTHQNYANGKNEVECQGQCASKYLNCMNECSVNIKENSKSQEVL